MVAHAADAPTAPPAGVLALHGFTGNPSSMRGVAEAFAGAGFHVELPAPARPRHHGRRHAPDPLGATGPPRSRRRTSASPRGPTAIVVGGLSMGGSLALWTALQPPRGRAGSCCVNPATTSAGRRGRGDARTTLLADGTELMPGIGSDIADPDAVEIAYEGTPLRPLLSLLDDGLAPMRRPLRRADDAAAAVHVAPGPRRRAEPERAPRRALRRDGRPPLARPQLPRRHPGLRPRDDLRRGDRVRPACAPPSVADADAERSGQHPAARRAGTLDIGPLSLNAYGLMIALGVRRRGVAARPAARGDGASAPARTPPRSACGPSPAGVIGARLYHVVTDWERFDGHLGDIVKIWQGGLGIPGGLLAGILVGIWVGPPPRHRRWPTAVNVRGPGARRSPRRSGGGATGSTRSCSAGRPTCRGRSRSTTSTCPPGYAAGHDVPPDVPLRVAVELRAVRRAAVDRQPLQRLRRGRLMAMYVVGYGIGRFWVEGLRIDPADESAACAGTSGWRSPRIVGGGLTCWRRSTRRLSREFGRRRRRHGAPTSTWVREDLEAERSRPRADRRRSRGAREPRARSRNR